MKIPPLLLAVLLAVAAAAPAQTITTVAGGLIVDGKPALSTPLASPGGVAVDAKGNVFVLDTGNNVVRKIDVNTGISTIVAGGGTQTNDKVAIPGPQAYIPRPVFGVVDKTGVLFFSDGSNRVRKLSSDGFVSTVAGNGIFGYSGDGGPATSATLGPPLGLTFDSAGNLFIADCYSSAVRKVDTAGIITTVVGGRGFGFTGDGGLATAATTSCPSGVAIDPSGNLFFVDANNNRIRRVDAVTGIITTVAGNGLQALTLDISSQGPSVIVALGSPFDIQITSAGQIFFTERLGRIRQLYLSPTVSALSTIAGAGFVTQDGASPYYSYVGRPQQLYIADALYFVDAGRNNVRRIGCCYSGGISTVAGTDAVFDGNTALNVPLASPAKISYDRFGNLLVVDQTHNRVRKIDGITGLVSTIAGTGLPGSSGDGGPATAATLQFPSAAVVGPSGEIYISDTFNNKIRRIDPVTGLISTYAGTGVAGSGGDFGLPTRAQLYSPDGLFVDRNGDLLVADAGNGIIRKIVRGGNIVTVAGNRTHSYTGDNNIATFAGMIGPTDIAADPAGNLFIADRLANAVRRIDVVTGVITTYAGNGVQAYGGDNGLATQAFLSGPNVLAVNSSGDLFIGETGNNIIRRVTSTGVITTFAGTPALSGYTGDGGPANKATLGGPAGLAFDAAGNLLVSDVFYHVIRSITPPPAGPVLEVTTQTLAFDGYQGGAPPAAQVFSVINNGFAPTSWSAQVQGINTGWLTLSATSGMAPAVVVARANQASLAPGVYRAAVIVNSPGAIGSPQTMTIQLTVRPAEQGTIVLSSQMLTFQATYGGLAPVPQPLAISAIGGGPLGWLALPQTVEATWLSVSSPLGQAPATIWVSVNQRGLLPGTYVGNIAIGDQRGGGLVNTTVMLTVLPAGGSLVVSQSGMQFNAVAGSAAPPPQRFTILNAGQGAMTWRISAATARGGSWLQAGPATGTSDGANVGNSPVASVLVNPTGLDPGVYTGTVTVTATGAVNSPQVVAVTMTVLAAGSSIRTSTDPPGLVFVRTDTDGPYTQSVELFNPGLPVAVSAVSTVATSASWLSVSAPKGALQGYGALQVSATSNAGSVSSITLSLPPGVYRGTITLQTGADPYQEIGVLFVVPIQTGGACFSSTSDIQVTSLPNNFVAQQGQAQPMIVRLVDSCGQPVTGATVTVSFDNGEPPLVLTDLRNGLYSATWNALLPAARVKLSVQAYHPAYRTPNFELTGTVPSTGAPLVFRSGAVNAATFRASALAPGSIFSVFGGHLANGATFSSASPLATALGGVSLKLGGMDVPLFYAGPGQINAQIPFEASAGTTLPLIATSSGGAAPAEGLQIAPASPGIFTVSQNGAGQGAVFSAGGTLVDASAPAAAGTVVQVFCTGLGAVDPPVPSGQSAPNGVLSRSTAPVTARLGGMDAPVRFAGLAPGYVGLYQVNVEIPPGVAPGTAALVLQAAGIDSNTVTLAVK